MAVLTPADLKKWYFVNTTAIFTAYEARVCHGPSQGSEPANTRRGIIDGDTIWVEYSDGMGGWEAPTKIRFMGVSAPELDKQGTLDAALLEYGIDFNAYPWNTASDPHEYYIYSCPIVNLRKLTAQAPARLLDIDLDEGTGAHDGTEIHVLVSGKGDFGRDLGLVFNKANTKCYNFDLIESGTATTYHLLPPLLYPDIWNSIARAKKLQYPVTIHDYQDFVAESESVEEDDFFIDPTGSNIDGACKIGLTWLPIGPDTINIVEQNANEEIPTIRTPGNPIRKTGLLNKRIEITAFFPSIDAMNNKLRVILAQFIRSPFLPIENNHIRKLIIGESKPVDLQLNDVDSYKKVKAEVTYDPNRSGHIDNPAALENYTDAFMKEMQEQLKAELKVMREDVDEYVKLQSAVKNDMKLLVGKPSKNTMDSVFSSTTAALNQYKSQLAGMGLLDTRSDIYKLLSDGTITNWNAESDSSKESFITKLKNHLTTIDNKSELHIKKADALIRKKQQTSDIPKAVVMNWFMNTDEGQKQFQNRDSFKNEIVLMCSLQEVNVATVPGFVENMQCTLVLDVFNYSAYDSTVKYCLRDEDALRQAAYYDNLYDYGVRDMTTKRYSSENLKMVKSTPNLEECEPFKRYLRPLLSGRPNKFKPRADISLSIINSDEIDYIQPDYIFWAPNNWFRPISGMDEFNHFRWEYDITELSMQQRVQLRTKLLEEDKTLQLQLQQLSSVLGTTLDHGVRAGGVKSVLDTFKDLVYEFAKNAKEGALALLARGEKFKDYLNLIRAGFDKSEYNLVLPSGVKLFKIRDGEILKGEGNELSGVINMQEFYDFFTSLEVSYNGRTMSGKDLETTLGLRDLYEDHLTYGNTTKYNFEFHTGEDTVITGMSASMQTRTADIPLESHAMPTKQFMGRSNWHVQMNLQTCNENILEIISTLSKKAALDSLTREQSNRDWFIYKSNAMAVPAILGYNAFFKFLGINNVLFEGFEYSNIDGRPGWFNLSMRFVQADMNIGEFEQILPWTQMFHKEVMDEISNVIFKNYSYDNENNNAAIKHIMRRSREVMMGLLLNIGHGSKRPPKLPEGRLDGSNSYLGYGWELNDFNEWLDTKATDIVKKSIAADPDKVFMEDVYIEEIYHSGVDKEVFYSRIWDMYFRYMLDFPQSNKMKTHVKYIKDRAYVVYNLKDIMDAIGTLSTLHDSAGMATAATRWAAKVGLLGRTIPGAQYGGMVTKGGYRTENIQFSIKERAKRVLGQIFPLIYNTKQLTDFYQEMVYDNMIYLRIKQAIVESAIYNRDLLVDYLVKNSPDKKDKHYWETRLNDSSSSTYITDTFKAKYYGGYPDLELPFSTGSLTLPADFFYIKPEIMGGDDVVSEDTKSLIEYMFENEMTKSAFINQVPGTRILQNIDANFERIARGYLEEFNKDWFKDYNPFTDDNYDRLIQRSEVNAVLKSDVYDIIDKLKEDLMSVMQIEEIPSYHDMFAMDNDTKSKVLRYYNQATRKYAGSRNIQAMGIAFDLIHQINKVATLRDTPEIDLDRLGTDEFLRMAKLLNAFEQIGKTPNEYLNNWGVYSPYSIAETEKIFYKSAYQVDGWRARDKTLHLGKAFPTYKLFFIEEDSRQWGMIDDCYMYNSVSDIKVVAAKGSASRVATLRVTNKTGKLSSKDSIFETESLLSDSLYDEQRVFGILAREGTIIMIKAGYDNNPARLPILFIGRIVSVEGSDELTIVAQSFGADMHEKALQGGRKKFGAMDNPKTHGDVLIEVVSSMKGLQNFGNTSIWESLGLEDQSATGIFVSQKSRTATWLRSMFPVIDAFYSFQAFDPRFENIYLPYTNAKVGQKQIEKAKEALWYSMIENANTAGRYYGWTFDWIVDNQSLWEIMNEMALYRANYIVTTLPYNENQPGLIRETIYMGPKNGYYRYTDLYDKIGNRKQIADIKKRSDANNSYFRDVAEFFHNDITFYEHYRSGSKRMKYMEAIMDVIWYINEKFDYDYNRNKLWRHSGTLSKLKFQMESIINKFQMTQYDAKYDLAHHKGVMWKIFAQNVQSSTYILRHAQSPSIELFLQDMGKIYFGIIDYNSNLKNNKMAWELYLKEVVRVAKEALEIQRDYESSISSRPMTPEEKRTKGYLKYTSLSINNPQDLFYYDEKEKRDVLSKGYRPVQNYYFVDSIHHIVQNNIRATSEEMYNNVVVRFNVDPTPEGRQAKLAAEFSVDDDIKNVKTYVSVQRNIDPPDALNWDRSSKFGYALHALNNWKWGFPTEAIVGYNILANVMRPMYRGDLTIIGNPSIKPHDIVFIKDYTNDMWGPIEVDEVVHQINENGFITVIKPHAIINPLDPTMRWEIESKNLFWTMNIGSWAMNAGASLLTSSLLSFGIMGASKALAKFAPKETVTSRAQFYKFKHVRADGTQDMRYSFSNPKNWRRSSVQTKTVSPKYEIPPHSEVASSLAAMVDVIPNAKGDEQLEVAWATRVGGAAAILAGTIFFPVTTAAITGVTGYLLTNFGSSMVSWTAGKMLGRECVDVIGLWKDGEPFVAGIEGMNKNTFEVHWWGRVANFLSFGANL